MKSGAHPKCGWRADVPPPPPKKKIKKYTGFVDTMLENVPHDLPFRQNQPLTITLDFSEIK